MKCSLRGCSAPKRVNTLCMRPSSGMLAAMQDVHHQTKRQRQHKRGACIEKTYRLVQCCATEQLIAQTWEHQWVNDALLLVRSNSFHHAHLCGAAAGDVCESSLARTPACMAALLPPACAGASRWPSADNSGRSRAASWHRSSARWPASSRGATRDLSRIMTSFVTHDLPVLTRCLVGQHTVDVFPCRGMYKGHGKLMSS